MKENVGGGSTSEDHQKVTKLNFEQGSPLIDKQRDKYLSNKVSGITPFFYVNVKKQVEKGQDDLEDPEESLERRDPNEIDTKILQLKFLQNLVATAENKKPTVADTFAASVAFAGEVQKQSGELGDLKIKFKGSKQGKDFCEVEFDILRKSHFFVWPAFGYF